MIDSPFAVKPGSKFNLNKRKTRDTGGFSSKEEGEAAAAENAERLGKLQQLLYADGRHALLVVLQGMDTSGKDGAIRSIFSGVDPQGCFVASFKAPSSQEWAHDYLWRIHAQMPPRGMITIFNRSHYESVLIERVRGIAPREVWSRRYEHINAFERMLVDEGTTVLKFFLHISKEEQRERLQARIDDPEKHWKYDPKDLAERELWDDYQKAYDDALRHCSTEHAPWYVIPSDFKWFRNWVISEIIVKVMKQMKLRYPPPLEGTEKIKVK